MNYLSEYEKEYSQIKTQLQKAELISDDGWKSIFRWLNFTKDNNRDGAREVLLRLLEVKRHIPYKLSKILEDYIEFFGLFPYLDIYTENLGVREMLRYEFHRSENMPDVIMHQEQTEIIGLLDRTSVVLSAPTSFGKSLLIDEIINSQKFDNIVIIVPTIALIDETRARLARYEYDYKLIFTTRQALYRRNIMILTPERFLELQSLPEVNFFIIDEFYKVGEDDERASVLNQAFYKLSKMTSLFYLLGPNISSIPQGFEEDYQCVFKKTEFSTVVTDEKLILAKPGEKLQQLVQLLLNLDEPTLIYCQSPARAEQCTNTMLKEMREKSFSMSEHHSDAINWIGQNVHSDWTLSSALSYDIAFHHGAIPRHLGRYVVNAFNEGKIKFLFCTSTLIEGVNTSARNVVVFDNRKSKSQPLTYFDYKNISGRAGRMKRYFMGRVFTFHSPPKESKMDVDFPWYTQVDASDEILIQIDEQDLKSNVKERIQHYKSNSFLSLDVIRKNYGLPVAGQISLAQEILSDISLFHQKLSWNGYPTKDQLFTVCDLMWRHLVTRKEGIYSQRQLYFHIITYWTYGKSLPGYINFILQNDKKIDTVDKAVQQAMNLVRRWFEFRFPKLLSAVESVQGYIFQTRDLAPGEYGYFASQIEYGFCPPALAELQEFGIPISLLRKLEPHIQNLDEIDIDSILDQVRALELSKLSLHPYEEKLLRQLSSSTH